MANLPVTSQYKPRFYENLLVGPQGPKGKGSAFFLGPAPDTDLGSIKTEILDEER